MPSTRSKLDRLRALARTGPFRARDLDDLEIPRSYLQRLCERGELERIDRGVYRLAGAAATELHGLAIVATRVPHAVICLSSALAVHELTTEQPHAVWVLIDRRARMPKLSYPTLEVVFASGRALTYGVDTRTIEGVDVAVTNPAKTVADCFRYRSHVGLDVAIDALRDYLRTRPRSIDALVEASRADRIDTFMRPYLEALA